MSKSRFTRAQLEADGFTGWIPFKQIWDDDRVPRIGGGLRRRPNRIGHA